MGSEGDRFQDWFRSVSEPLLLLDDEGNVFELNAAAERALGTRSTALAGKNFASLCETRWAEDFRSNGSRTPVRGEFSFERDGHLVHFECEGCPLGHNPELAVRFWERAARPKDELLAKTGHELRNPLAPMLSALELMDLKDRFLFQRERSVLSRQLRQLKKLVDDLLDSATSEDDSDRPSEARPTQTPLQRLARRADRTRVLIVDDNADAAEMLKESLEGLGYLVRAAYDAPDALRAVRDFIPNVALLDIGLPTMSGYELGARLRSQPGLSDLQLIAVTGYGQPRDRLETSKAGFSNHFVKPVNLDRLVRALDA